MVKITRLFFLIMLITTAFTIQSTASHIMGGTITYRPAGGVGNYEIQLTLYRDCNGIALGNNATINLTSSACGSFSTNLSLVPTYPADITPVCSTAPSVCSSTPGGTYGIEKYLYSGTVTLTGNCNDWTITYSNCCMNGSITNISNPSSSNVYLETTLTHNTQGISNYSPYFVQDPILFATVNDTVVISNAALDPNGDSLVYSLATPSQAIYNLGFNPLSPITGSASIDAETGELTLIPTTIQIAAMAVQIEEYRNGIKIGTIRREFQLAVINSSNNNNLPKITGINGVAGNFSYTSKLGSPIQFTIPTYDADAGQMLSLTTGQNYLGANISTNTAAQPTATFTWTPTNIYQLGKHYFTMQVEDNNCPIKGINQYVFEVNIEPNNDSLHVGQSMVVCLDTFNVGSPLGSLSIIGDTLNNATVDWSDLSTACFQLTATQTGTDSMLVEICDPSTTFCDTFSIRLITYDTSQSQNIIYTSIENTVAAGSGQEICLNTDSLSGAVQSVQLYSGSPQHITIDSIDGAGGCVWLTANSLGSDTLEFELFDNLSNSIIQQFIIHVEVGVWPGDTDTNGVVNNFDLLNIGLGYGTTGTPRANPSIFWDGYIATDWGVSTAVTNIDYKHIDANGDGTINANDTVAIVTNWGNSYSYQKNGFGGNLPIYINTNVAVDTEHIELPIILGNMSFPANNVHGLAFTVTYDTSLVEPKTAHFDFSNSWFGTIGTDMISIEKDFYNDGRISGAITKIDGINSNGFGQIGTLNLTIQDDILQKGLSNKEFLFDIIEVKLIDNMEQTILVSPVSDTLKVATNAVPRIDHLVTVYPNPATNQFTVQTKSLQLETLRLLDLNGRILFTENNLPTTTTVDVHHLPIGIYFLQIQTDKGVINKKVSVTK